MQDFLTETFGIGFRGKQLRVAVRFPFSEVRDWEITGLSNDEGESFTWSRTNPDAEWLHQTMDQFFERFGCYPELEQEALATLQMREETEGDRSDDAREAAIEAEANARIRQLSRRLRPEPLPVSCAG